MPPTFDPMTPPPRRTTIALLLIALLWIVAVAAIGVVVVRALAMTRLALADTVPVVGALVLQVAAPLAIVLVAIELVRRSNTSGERLAELETRTAQAAATTGAVRDGLLDIDATLAAIAGRLDGLRDALRGDPEGVIGAATRLESATAEIVAGAKSSGDAARSLLETLPIAQRHADSIAAILATTGAETARQIEGVETMLAGVWTRNADARAQVELASATTAGLLAGIETAAVAAADAIAARTASLDIVVDAAFDRTTAALDATRDGVHVQTSALLASVDQARVALDAIGGEAAAAIAERLAHAVEVGATLGHGLAEHDARSRMLVATIERSFTVLDARLGHAATSGTTTLDGFGARIAALRAQLDAIDAPLAATGVALRDAEASVERLGTGTDAAARALAEVLPEHRDTISQLRQEFTALGVEASALAQPVATARAAVVGAGAEFAIQRDAVATAATELVRELDAARGVLAAIEGTATGSALTASTALIEVLSRVREVANATAGTMRTTLAGVVAEAEAALTEAGTARAAAAFGDPIRHEISGLEGAATLAGTAVQGVADRIAARLLGLTATVATVEARIDEADTRFDLRLRDDIAKRSANLLESLNGQAIDIARPMAIDVSDSDWAAYLKGDRSLFARRAARLIDGGTARAIARHYQHDPLFSEQATRYLAEFETLLDRVRGDREGKALAVTLVSSDLGKLYVVLGEALERLR